MSDGEKCPTCGAEVSITRGPDIRFTPPSTQPMMWRAWCGGSCVNPSLEWTRFTRESALNSWNEGVRNYLESRKGDQHEDA